MLYKTCFRSILFILACLFIVSCAKTEDQEEIEEEIFIGLEGKYGGGWTSVTESTSFTDYPVTAIFRYSNESQTMMTGEFFATGNFTSTSDLDNDGTMTFTLDDDVINNFYFDDKIVGCEGIFRGQGIVTSEEDFEIEFTGTDCDGTHSGTLIFVKK